MIQQNPSRFELVDRELENSRKSLSKSLGTTAVSLPHISQTRQTISSNPLPKFRKPNTYFSSSLHKRSILGSDSNHTPTIRKQKTVREKERLLEKRIKKIEAELRSLGASCKDIYEIHGKSIRYFFNKVHCWQAEKIKNYLLQQIDDKDVELNDSISAEQITRSNSIDQIWE